MQCLRLEEVNSTDPNAFWDYIRRLGPNKKSKIPWECYDDNGVVVDDPERVLKSWRDEFGSLYCSTTPSEIDDEQIDFKQYIVNDNKEFERMPLDNTSYINQPFSRDEISKVVWKSKTNKAPGIDGIVYDVLKNELTTDLLTTFFNLCFETHKVPEIWVEALIYPIPKSPTNDPRVPLNYRGISLLSVISKLYTAALNAMLNNYTETNGYIVNTNKDYRKHWFLLWLDKVSIWVVHSEMWWGNKCVKSPSSTLYMYNYIHSNILPFQYSWKNHGGLWNQIFRGLWWRYLITNFCGNRWLHFHQIDVPIRLPSDVNSPTQ